MMLEIAGNQFENFTSAVCEIRLDSLSSSFNFQAVATNGQALPFKVKDSCKVIVDGEIVLTGSIEVISSSYDAGSYQISIRGRDKTADLIDSTLDSIDDIRGDGLTLKTLIEKVISQLKIDISVIDLVDPEPFNAAEDVISPEPGDNAFSFIEKYARKRQVLLTSNSDGDLVIATNSGQTAPGAVQHIIGANDNNVISSNFSFDTTGRFNIYKIISNQNPVALNLAGNTTLSSIAAQGGFVVDSDINTGRQLIIVSEVPFSSRSCEDRAKWEADIRRARGLVYSAVVPFYRVNGVSGDLWTTNRIYQIVDDFVGKVEPMLCNSVVYSLSIDDRSTSLGFVGADSYKLFAGANPTSVVADNVS